MTFTPDREDGLIRGPDLVPGDIIHIPRGVFEVIEIKHVTYSYLSLRLRHVDHGYEVHVPTAGLTPFALVQSHAERETPT
jgi:hypothetical protein